MAPEGYGEIIGGGQRIHDLDLLLKRLEEHNLPQEAFDWYLDLRKFGGVPHGGFGMGVERCRRLDLRPRARPRNDRVPAHAVPDEAVDASVDGSQSSARRWIWARDAAASTWVLRRSGWRGSDERLAQLGYDVEDLGNVESLSRRAYPRVTNARAICRRSRKPAPPRGHGRRRAAGR